MTARKHPVLVAALFSLLIPSATNFSHAVYLGNLGDKSGSGIIEKTLGEKILTTKNPQTDSTPLYAPDVIEVSLYASVFCLLAAVFYLNEKSGKNIAQAGLMRKIFPSTFFKKDTNYEKCISISCLHRRDNWQNQRR